MSRALSAWALMLFWLLATPWEMAGGESVLLTICLLALAVVTRARMLEQPSLEPAAGVKTMMRVGIVASIIPMVVLPWPYCAPAVFYSVGAVLASTRNLKLRTLGRATMALCPSLLAGLAVVGLQYYFGCRVHEVPSASPLIGRILDSFGHQTSVVDGRLRVFTPDFVHDLTPTAEAFGLFPWTLWLASGGLEGLRGGERSWRTCSATVILLMCYAVVRLAVLDSWIVSSGSGSVLWRAGWTALTMLPPVVLIGLILPKLARRGLRGGPNSFPLSWQVPVGVGVGAFCIWLAVTGTDPGFRKQGRVLIHEAHSKWERTDAVMDTQRFGQESTYAFTALAELLGYYYSVDTTESVLNPALLSDVDVLIIKTPTSAYQASEVLAVRSFVEAGGGLLLVGDHTNVFGTSTYLEPIAEVFGLGFAHDATYDADTGGLTLYEGAALGRHGAVASLESLLFGTSCSLEVPVNAQMCTIGYRMTASLADYGKVSYFADGEDSRYRPFGVFPQSAGVAFGRGRVLAFTDSTIWSNFWMFVPGKRELALGFVEWLCRSNRFEWSRIWLLLGGVALLAGGIVALGSMSSITKSAIAVVSVMVGFAISECVCRAINETAYPPPAPVRSMHEIRFLRTGTNWFLPERTLIPVGQPSYLTFFTWAYRVKMIPRKLEVGESPVGVSPLVVLNPQADSAVDVMTAVEQQLAAGGSVLLVASREFAGASVSLLKRLGVGVNTLPPNGEGGERSMILPTRSSQAFEELREFSLKRFAKVSGKDAWRIDGGVALVRDGSQDAIMSIVDSPGRGRLVIVSDPAIFEDEAVGPGSAQPDQEQRSLYRLIFMAYRALGN